MSTPDIEPKPIVSSNPLEVAFSNLAPTVTDQQVTGESGQAWFINRTPVDYQVASRTTLSIASQPGAAQLAALGARANLMLLSEAQMFMRRVQLVDTVPTVIHPDLSDINYFLEKVTTMGYPNEPVSQITMHMMPEDPVAIAFMQSLGQYETDYDWQLAHLPSWINSDAFDMHRKATSGRSPEAAMILEKGSETDIGQYLGTQGYSCTQVANTPHNTPMFSMQFRQKDTLS